MPAITLCTATEADTEQILSLILNAFEEYRGVLNPPSGAHRETLDTIRTKIIEGGGFIAYVDDTAAGCVLYEPETDALYLGRLAVLPDFRKQGVAHALVEAVETRARELNLSKVTLGVRAQLPGNRAFFEHLGFQFVATGSHDGHSEPTFTKLEKPLPSG
ncbi:MAG: GNAT family N-acetyltransferase [Anaerolineae bacterium]|nr:GNAT family N-acetyltransferase [Anaerolineae bacterium]